MVRNARFGGSPSTATVVTLVLALAILAATASVDTPFRSLLRREQADPARILSDLLPVLLLGAGLTVVWALVRQHRAREHRGGLPFRTTLVRSLPLAAAGIVGGCLLLLAHFDFAPPRDDGDARHQVEAEPLPRIAWSMSDWFGGLVLAGEGTGDPERRTEVGTAGGRSRSFLLIVMGLATALLAGAILWHLHRRSRTEGRPEQEDEDHEGVREQAREALTETIRAMLADPNPNTAIRGAYARLLQGLGERGRGRLEHEGPMEHLHRVLTTLRVRPGPLRELIELFELARFSPHALSGWHRDRALLALRAVAADLDAVPGNGA